jgi:hypothetical protein
VALKEISIELNGGNANVAFGTSRTFTVTTVPADSAIGIEWEASPADLVASSSVDGNEFTVTVGNTAGAIEVRAKGTGEYAAVVSDPVTLNVRAPVPATDVTITNKVGELAIGSSYTFTIDIEPTGSTDDPVWTSSDNNIITVTNGVIEAAEGALPDQSATITVRMNDSTSDQVTVTLTGLAEPAFVIFNQAATPATGTTTTMPEMNAETNRFTIVNMHNGASSTGIVAAGYTNSTFVYLNNPIEGNASITARVRITERHATTQTDTGSGILIGMFTEPRGNGNFLPGINITGTPAAGDPPPVENRGWFHGVRVAQNATLASAGARSSDNTNGGSTTVPGTTGRAWDDEYIIEVSRTTLTNFVITVRDRNGVQLGTITRSGGQVQSFDPAYVGFIIHGVTVEISQIQIRDNATFTGATIIETPASQPTAVGAITGVTVTGPSSVLANGTSTAFSATVQPLSADQAVTWTVGLDEDGTEADISEFATWDATARTLTGVSQGTVYVTATSVGNTEMSDTVAVVIEAGISWSDTPLVDLTFGDDGDWATAAAAGTPPTTRNNTNHNNLVTLTTNGVTFNVGGANDGATPSVSVGNWHWRVTGSDWINPNGARTNFIRITGLPSAVRVEVEFAATGAANTTAMSVGGIVSPDHTGQEWTTHTVDVPTVPARLDIGPPITGARIQRITIFGAE